VLHSNQSISVLPDWTRSHRCSLSSPVGRNCPSRCQPQFWREANGTTISYWLAASATCRGPLVDTPFHFAIVGLRQQIGRRVGWESTLATCAGHAIRRRLLLWHDSITATLDVDGGTIGPKKGRRSAGQGPASYSHSGRYWSGKVQNLVLFQPFRASAR
jgi:hypothetical protein